MEQIKINGIYKHYKGNEYQVLFIGYDADDAKPCVIYRALYFDPKFVDHAIWTRKLNEFIGYLPDGTKRFTYQPIKGFI